MNLSRISTLGALAAGSFALAACAGATALAQQEDGAPRTLAFGDTVAGTLLPGDPTLGERGRFQVFRFQGRAGQRVAIRLDSDKFDPFLVLARTVRGITDEVATDDDGGEGFNALLRATLPEDGTYLVVAQALSDGESGMGDFTLALEELPPPPPPRTLGFDEAVSGRLEDTDAVLSTDGSAYDLWTFRGRAGQRVVIRMESDDFDAFLTLGRMDGAVDPEEMMVVASDDDGADGTNSLLRATLEEDGEYAIRANAFGADGRGAYTLRLEERVPVPVPAPTPVAAGRTVEGELGGDDPLRDSEAYFDQYVVRARSGDRLTVTLRSEEFDTYLQLGRLQGDDFRELASDDDGADEVSTDSRVEYDVERDGEYVIRATSFSPNAVGAYRLEVESSRR